jgi:hypothetical protein
MVSKNIENKLVAASQTYADNTALRAAVTAIPFIGGSMDVVFSSIASQVVYRRIWSVIRHLEEEMKSIDEAKINKDFLESEEWFDLVYKTFDEARKTRLDEKHKMFARILVNVSIKQEEIDNIERYQGILTDISLTDFKVAAYLVEHVLEAMNGEYKERKKFWSELAIDGISDKQLKQSLARLFTLGLVQERYGAIMDYTGGHYIISDLLYGFVKFIEQEAGK